MCLKCQEYWSGVLLPTMCLSDYVSHVKRLIRVHVKEFNRNCHLVPNTSVALVSSRLDYCKSMFASA